MCVAALTQILGARVGSWRGRWDVWCSWATALSVNWNPLLCWESWCHGHGSHGETAGGGKDEHVCGQRNTLGLDLAWVWIWLRLSLDPESV